MGVPGGAHSRRAPKRGLGFLLGFPLKPQKKGRHTHTHIASVQSRKKILDKLGCLVLKLSVVWFKRNSKGKPPFAGFPQENTQICPKPFAFSFVLRIKDIAIFLRLLFARIRDECPIRRPAAPRQGDLALAVLGAVWASRGAGGMQLSRRWRFSFISSLPLTNIPLPWCGPFFGPTFLMKWVGLNCFPQDLREAFPWRVRSCVPESVLDHEPPEKARFEEICPNPN